MARDGDLTLLEGHAEILGSEAYKGRQRVMKTYIYASVATVLCVASASPASARCIGPNWLWCNGCAVNTAVTMPKNTTCFLNSNAFAGMVSVRILSKPRNGFAGTASDYRVAYKPNENFVGKDSFSYEATYNDNSLKHHKSIVNMEVTVTEK